MMAPVKALALIRSLDILIFLTLEFHFLSEFYKIRMHFRLIINYLYSPGCLFAILLKQF